MTKKFIKKIFNSLIIRRSSFKKKVNSRKIQIDTENVPSKVHKVPNKFKLYNLMGLIGDGMNNLNNLNDKDKYDECSEICKFILPVQQLTITGTYENSSGMILLSKLCTNVRDLCIENFSTAKNIDHIIESQNNLVSLEITNLSDHSTLIIQSILSQSKSLRRIKFYKVQILA
ncbi:hypothetical protein C1646_661575 [Rhizophagus diaphanus]|nr:hypothetical protein C1646_661575 [Rhizophagus diaphanus] [Rhizophagus sp. MUCL 43196]